MGLFSKQLDSYLGIDVGGQSIKLVELYNDKGKPKLRTYGVAEIDLPFGSMEKDRNAEEIAMVIKMLCKRAKVFSNKVITSLPTYDVFTSIINLPQMSKKEMDAAVSWEAKKLIPLPLEDMSLHWEELKLDESKKEEEYLLAKDKYSNGGKTKEGEAVKIKKKTQKNIKLLLVAAPKVLGIKYVNIFKHAGLTLLEMEPEIFALVRSLVGNDRSISMIVEVGAMNTNISVVDQGIPVLNRGVDAGGTNITKVLERLMEVGNVQAEQFKRDLADYLGTRDFGKEMPKDLEIAVSPIINEIKYIYSLFTGASGVVSFGGGNNGNIEKIVLTGGSAVLPYFRDHLSKVFDAKVYIGDPWARIDYPEDLKYLLEEMGPKMSISAGLAMRNIV